MDLTENEAKRSCVSNTNGYIIVRPVSEIVNVNFRKTDEEVYSNLKKYYTMFINSLCDIFKFHRSYNEGTYLYYFVFNPLLQNYTKYKDVYNSSKFIDSVRKYIITTFPKYEWCMVTRETLNCNQPHVNALILTHSMIDEKQYRRAINQKFGSWCVEKPLDLHTRVDLLKYITKEYNDLNKLRYERYEDWTYFENPIYKMKDDISSDDSQIDIIDYRKLIM